MRNPQLRCARSKRDDVLIPHIQRVWQANMQVYGANKVWHQMNREGIPPAEPEANYYRRLAEKTNAEALT